MAAPDLDAAPPSFAVVERTGDPAELVVPPPSPSARLAVFARPTRRALVLGSAQPETAADAATCAVADIAVVRRRSGGGAVLVGPAEQVWLDVFVPADDPLFEPDVSRAAWWLGDVWVAALDAAGRPGACVHRGSMVPGPYGRAACFAGLGPGEVTLEGRKLVGISQRRDRHGAWLFTMALLSGAEHVRVLAGLLRLDRGDRDRLAHHLAATTTSLDLAPGILEAALAAGLGRLGTPL